MVVGAINNPLQSSPRSSLHSISPRLESPALPKPLPFDAGADRPAGSDLKRSPDGFGSFQLDGVVLAVLLVNFHHLLGPVVEFAHPPNILASPSLDPDIPRLLPFFALPDGAHLSDEDYSYFHLVANPQADHPPGEPEEEPFPINQTVFGISCNRQLAASELINRPEEVTRSTVQMAVVVLARQPVFGPIRDKLGVVTRAFFAQKDFTSTDILVDFHRSLEGSLRGTVSETTMHMGTNLRELIHKFRHKTLILLKLMLLQKKIMFFGYPVERLCTLQYTLVSLIPGLLMNLADCGSATLDSRASGAKRASSLRTSDRASMLRFFGFPLTLFGKDAFFQPYLPLQQIDMCKAPSWLVGTTNSIMIQQRDATYDCLVNVENMTLEFPDQKLERLVALTAADRKWMDDINRTVEDTWNPVDPSRPIGMSFKGSDDFLRAKFEEYLCSVLASMKYADYLAKSTKADSLMTGGNANSLANFSTQWTREFRTTAAFQLWDQSTDPVLFDIWDPKHPCEGRVNAVSDIGLRLAEGIHDLKIEQNLAPTREALSSALNAGSSTFFRAFEGVKAGFSSQLAHLPHPPSPADSRSTAMEEDSPGPSSSFLSFVSGVRRTAEREPVRSQSLPAPALASQEGKDLKTAVLGLGTFWGSKLSRFGSRAGSRVSSRDEAGEIEEGAGEWVPVDLDAKRSPGNG